ncbi:MAG: heme A synthase [Acidimicrobiales bacterium]
MRSGLTLERYRRLTMAAMVLLYIIVVSGATVRLTGSGLGCSSWPQCESYRAVPAADFHAWVEFGNRLFTGAVAIAVVLAVLGARRLTEPRPDLVRLAWGLVAGVVAQILIGGITVRLELLPGIVAVHFLVSMVLIVNATVLHFRAGVRESQPQLPTQIVGGIWAMFAATSVVTILGTVVTAAGPHAGDEDANRLNVPLESVAKIHTASVFVLIAIVAFLIWSLLKSPYAEAAVTTSLKIFVGIVVIQATIGYIQYFNDIPALLVGAHVAGATASLLAATWTLLLATSAKRQVLS